MKKLLAALVAAVVLFPVPAHAPRETLHFAPLPISTEDSFSITWDRLVTKRGAYRQAQSQYWHINCIAGGSQGTLLAQAYEPLSGVTDVDGAYRGVLERRGGTPGQTVFCRLLIEAYATRDMRGPIGSPEYLDFQATIR